MRRRLPQSGPNLNWQVIVPVIAGTCLAVGLGLVACAAVALAGGDGAARAFTIPAAAVIPLSLVGLLGARRLPSMPLRARDGFFAVTMAWVVAAAVGAVPFLVADTFERPLDAFFESMSGFTTTGATLLDRVDDEPDAVLLWRSLSQWLGGVGIVVLVVAIAPATGLAQRAFQAETTGVTAERLTPRIADTAKIIWGIYLVLSAAGCAAFVLAGMGLFDALNHALTTVATGGFSTRPGSLGEFDSVAIELVAIVFMIAGGINFAFYWRALRGSGIWPQAAEVRLFLGLVVVATVAVAISLDLNDHPGDRWEAVRDAGFTVTSFLSSTAFVTEDVEQWNDFARSAILVLMFIGGCAGSTAGGLKVIRVLLLAKTAVQEVQRQLQPKAVQVLRTRGRVYGEEVRRAVLGFFFVYMTVALAGAFAFLATGLDLATAVSASVATLNLVGTGLGEIGATDNYAAIDDAGRAVAIMLMLAGRLEIFTVLVLFTPAFWRPRVA